MEGLREREGVRSPVSDLVTTERLIDVVALLEWAAIELDGVTVNNFTDAVITDGVREGETVLKFVIEKDVVHVMDAC